MVLNTQKQKSSIRYLASIGSIAFSFVAGITFFMKLAFANQAITLEQAQALAKKAEQTSQFPLTVNKLVLKQLNYYAGTEDGKKFARDGMKNLEAYQNQIESILRQSPVENKPPQDLLLAIPIVESKAINRIQKKGILGAGLWGFIVSTAKKYGLQVSEKEDERRNVDRSTQAAIQYLSDIYGMFHDWRFATKSYNEGENHVAGLIDSFRTRFPGKTPEPWEIEIQSEGPEQYLSRITAMIIIQKNPSLVR